MGTSAFTSAAVSVFTMWLWGVPGQMPPTQPGAVTVTYEPLDAASGDERREPASEPAPADAPTTPPAPAMPARASSTNASRLVVITEPAGARVTINGMGYGTTPLTVARAPSGTKRIRVTKSGYRSEERVIDAGRTLRISLRASPAARGAQ